MGAGLWCSPGDDEEVTAAFCEALRNRVERLTLIIHSDTVRPGAFDIVAGSWAWFTSPAVNFTFQFLLRLFSGSVNDIFM